MFLLKYLFFQLVKIYLFFKTLLTPRDFSINKIDIDYTVDNSEEDDYEDMNDFWTKESRYWCGDDLEMCNAIVPGRDINTIKPVPKWVNDIVIRINYNYDGRNYKCITKDLDYAWPPKAPEPSFKIPLKSVILVDEDDKPVYDITKKIKKYIGPHMDFHGYGETVRMRELLYFTEFSKIKVTNVMNIHKTLTCESTLRELL